MYTEFFGLNEKPFAITPDPRYLYLSRRHADALAHLIYGISESGGFIQLTGEVGTGKTTLIRSLLEQLPEKAEIALILNPQLSTEEFLQAISEELRIAPAPEPSVKALIDRLNAHLLRAHADGRRVVLIVDEAQNLSTELLEQVRLLTNLETAKQKLLQIILIGQPELRDVLERREMRQIAQRVTGRYHLEPLGREDTVAYVRHRMRVAGCQAEVFTASAMREIYRRSSGIPRVINVIADRALLAAYTRESSKADGRLVRRAAGEVLGRRLAPVWWRWAAVGCIGAAAAAAFAASNLWQGGPARPMQIAAIETPPTPTIAAREEPAPPEETRSPPLAELLASRELPSDTDSAVAALFALWGIEYEPDSGEPPCVQAAEYDLRCLFQEGSISQLRRLNRPAILSLVDDGGNHHQVVISGLSYDRVELSAAGKTFEVSLAELTHYWYGDQLLLWRPGLSEPKDLVPGMRDEGVLWLRESLARIDGAPLPGEPTMHYDRQLEARVREYQRSRRLTVDGIVGAKTQIAITTDLGMPGTPWLDKGH